MVFSSITFIFYFLPIILLLYYIVPFKYKNFVLLIFSLLFYMYGDISYVWVLLLSCFINYIGGILIDKYRGKSKTFLIMTLTIDLGLLLYFKYYNFIIQNVNNLLNTNLSLYNIVLPLGISFFTFQTLSYVIDVYNKKVAVNKNFINFSTYVCLFPQLIAGPIVRYKDIDESLKLRDHSFFKFRLGIERFIIGLSKKVIIANMIGELINSLNAVTSASVLSYILLAISYTLQLYFDFSGYSDMAIGLGSMFGFEFMENFNYPLISKSITDFWRRWHISLSSFFKDYVYIPLGGNKTSKFKHIRNIFVVWFLTGLWHGANWNFILWGLFFFIILILEKYLLHKFLDKHQIIAHIYSIVIIVISFTIFSITDLNELVIFIKSMFGFNHLSFINGEVIYYFKSYFILLVSALILSTPLIKSIFNKYQNRWMDILKYALLFGLLVLSVSALIDSSFNPFLYFRF